MAITDLTGTKWVIKETPNVNLVYDFQLDFISNGTNFETFALDADDSYHGYGLFYDSVYAYGLKNTTWQNQAYRIIEITGGTDATNTDLITWLENNATQVPIVDLTGTKWVINESLTIPAFTGMFEPNFISNNTSYSKFYLGCDDDDRYNLPNRIYYSDDSYVNTEVYNAGQWANEAYRIIEITGGTDATNATLIAWLVENATQVIEPTKINNFSVGNLPIDNMYFGTQHVKKVYLGQTLIYESTPSTYTIGFTGMSQSTPALTRTDSAVGATYSTSNGVIEVTGLDMSKIWGGYIGNDGEELTWDGTNFLSNGEVYSGNVFSKINRFFCKPIYVDSTLDGYQLIYADTQPEGTQDWFYGKDYVGIGCYKACVITGSEAMVSIRGRYSGRVQTNANNAVKAYKLASTTNGNLHEKWFNEDAILKVLFMVIFATRQTEDVFPKNTYRAWTDSKATGFLDSMRTSSSIATGYTTSYAEAANGNIFLGVEDFIGLVEELVAGIIFSNTVVQTTMDFANFSFSGSYATADISIPPSSVSGQYVKSLQQSDSVSGLLLPKELINDADAMTTYFCDKCYVGGNCLYNATGGAYDDCGAFYFVCSGNTSSMSGYLYSGRLCRTPA